MSTIEPLPLAPSSTAALSNIKLAQRYIGKSIEELQVPAFILDKSLVVDNVQRLHTKINDESITKLLTAAAGLEQGERKLLFRPHVKTLKSEAVTRAALGYDIDGKPESDESAKLPKYHSVVASTIEEIRGLWPLVVENKVDDIMYGVPVSQDSVAELSLLRSKYLEKGADITLFVDDIEQIQFLQDVEFQKRLESVLETSENVESVKKLPEWKVVMKIDADEHRAGTRVRSADFFKVLKGSTQNAGAANGPFNFNCVLRGFYAHAGASYDSYGTQVNTDLERELRAVVEAAKAAREALEETESQASKLNFLLSIGATPTAHAFAQPTLEPVLREGLHPNDRLELHAGNFVALDLQQVSTGLAETKHIAGTVLTQVLSHYEGRSKYKLPCCNISHDDETGQAVKKQKPENGPEYLVNAGVLALTREPPHGDGTKVAAARGLAQVKGYPNWAVTRVSQEHGIVEYLGEIDGDRATDTKMELKPWVPGKKLQLYPQHACIVAAMHSLYFIVDGSETIVDVWQPWKFW